MMMRISIILLFLFLGQAQNSFAQDSELTDQEQAVKDVILKVFDAMREKDSVKLKQCFKEKVSVYTSGNHPSKGNMLAEGSFQQFVTSIGTPHPGIYDERLGEYEVFIDDSLASFIVDYYFFVDENFSHCGVDFFQLHKKNNEWRIFFLSDTRRKKDCEIPQSTW